MLVQRAQEVLLRDLFRSFLSAFVAVAVVMMLVLRSVPGGFVAMFPNLFPTVALFGAMGLLREPLDIGSVMTASVALGIAVDDTMHLLSRFGAQRARGLGPLRASYGAIRQCGPAMTQTTLVCGLSLLIYWLSDFVPTSRFAVLMFGLLTAALVGDFIFLPAILSSRLGRVLTRPVGSQRGAEVTSDRPRWPTFVVCPPDVAAGPAGNNHNNRSKASRRRTDRTRRGPSQRSSCRTLCRNVGGETATRRRSDSSGRGAKRDSNTDRRPTMLVISCLLFPPLLERQRIAPCPMYPANRERTSRRAEPPSATAEPTAAIF